MAKIKKSTIESPSTALTAVNNGKERYNGSRHDSQCDSWSSWYDEMCSAPFATEAPYHSNVRTVAADSVYESHAATSVRSETVSEPPEFSPPKDIEQAHLVLMARDPYSAYAYWNVPEAPRPEPEPPLIVRLYQGTPEAKEDAALTKLVEDVPAAPSASQYFEPLSANAHYYAELGSVQDDGDFIVVASSNAVVTPRDGCVPATGSDPLQADASENEYRSFGVSEGEVRAYYRELVSRMSQPRRKRVPHDINASILLSMPKTENAPALAYGESSWLLGANDGFHHAEAAALFAQVDVEVVVFGRVQPGAQLKLDKTVVPLRTDGTFSMRLAIPPGGLRLPFIAWAKGRARRIALAVDYKKQDCSGLSCESDNGARVTEDSLDQLSVDSSGEISS